MSQNEAKSNSPQEEELHEEGGGFSQILLQTPSWLVSMIVHTVLLLTLALMTVSTVVPVQIADYTATPEVEEDKEEEVDEVDINIEEIDPDQDVVDEVVEVTDVSDEIAVESDEPMPAIVEVDPVGVGNMTPSDIGSTLGSFSGSGLSGRRKAKEGAISRGATSASELAVARGLQWIARHQYANGGWNYDHRGAPTCQGKCKNPGAYHQAVNGATAMGILPFLGCGITHKQGSGEYKKVVYRGLHYLLGRQQPNGSFHLKEMESGTMYSHGLAAICLTEAYGMTRDNVLRIPAQKAIDFIVEAQDQGGGGWRYQPKQKGDTSVVGWQMMALKSGYMAYLKVPATSAQKAMRFLDSVQVDGGAQYGYENQDGNHPACTAIGLLCRMYYGWSKENPALQKGVQFLSGRGPSGGDMYFNYYATQVLHHYEGQEWRTWNDRMRNQLVDTQISDKASHEFGSWYGEGGGDHGTDKGGRLYKTALSVMTLEVYYRHSPIYKPQSTQGGLPLE